MKVENSSNALTGTAEQASLAKSVWRWEETCKNCNPLTPITCVTSCKIWIQKNEFRRLHEKMKNPTYLKDLRNTLKNKRRLQILDMVSKGQHSVARLQRELRRLGYYHSQQTMADEYLFPLINVGLVEENEENQYHSTLFGHRLNGLARDWCDVADILPPHSECYEEDALSVLIYEPKAIQDFQYMIPAKSIARVLGRLHRLKLVETAKEHDYVFYFRTKRDPNNAKFTSTETRIYENIVTEGISARKLAEKTGISLRRTYKYLRKLKGKKLVFSRKKPKTYSLTAKGSRVAEFLGEVRNLNEEIQATMSYLLKDEIRRSLKLTSHPTESEKEKKIALAHTFAKQC